MRDASSGHDASLHFIGGQLLLEYKDGEAVVRKCISPEAARNAFSSAGIDSDWLPEHVCRYGIGPGGPWLLLRFPPGRYLVPLADPIRLSGGGAPHTMLAVPMPGLLFLGYGTRYYVWAYKLWKYAATKLFKAPLANVYPDGAICFGNVHPRVATATRLQTAGDYSGIVTFPTISQVGNPPPIRTISCPSWRNFTQLRHKTILSMILSQLTSQLPPSFVN
ncbi:MAG: hypothetical protein IPL14_19290 [Nitrospira sp.]|nr:hypothetical protein [Nitrospira sp.]